MNSKLFMGIAAMLTIVSPAAAAPGVGDPVYGATVTKGLTEFEAVFGRLTGGSADGDDGAVLEIEHGFTPRLAVAIKIETGRSLGTSRRADAVAVEVIRTLGKLGGIDTAIYLEAKKGLHGEPDVIEIKGLFERTRHNFDARVNLIAEKPLRDEPVSFGYAASVDWAVIGDEFRLGAAAFGDLGTAARFGGRQEHYAGPVAKLGIEHIGPGEIEVEAGYLRAFGAARDNARGQVRVLLSYEAHF